MEARGRARLGAPLMHGLVAFAAGRFAAAAP